VLAYDDIANNSENPFKGKLYNKPNGQDVYAGCNIDYKGKDVTPETFLNVLQGNAAANAGKGTGKVLKSDENSKVFVFFSDHGAPGLVAFPRGELYADQLNTAFESMHSTNMYKQMVFYLETCESGSMFDGHLKDNLNIYAVTAANPTESSWGTYCYPNDLVNGKHMGTCLGDLFSVNWMENADSVSPNSETLEEQFAVILKTTAQSHVMRYGQMDFTNEVIGEFEGDLDGDNSEKFLEKVFNRELSSKHHKKELDSNRHSSTVSSRDAKMHHLYAKVAEGGNHKAHLDLSTEINHRMRVDNVFAEFKGHNLQADQYHAPKNFDCLRSLVEAYKENCGALEDYSLKYVKYLVQECETLSNPSDYQESIQKLLNACSH